MSHPPPTPSLPSHIMHFSRARPPFHPLSFRFPGSPLPGMDVALLHNPHLCCRDCLSQGPGAMCAAVHEEGCQGLCDPLGDLAHFQGQCDKGAPPEDLSVVSVGGGGGGGGQGGGGVEEEVLGALQVGAVDGTGAGGGAGGGGAGGRQQQAASASAAGEKGSSRGLLSSSSSGWGDLPQRPAAAGTGAWGRHHGRLGGDAGLAWPGESA